MNKLNFTPVDKAFTLGSSQIKDTQEEIAQLTKLILESNTQTKPSKNGMVSKKEQNLEPPQGPYGITPSPVNYMRVGYPDSQAAIFRPPPQQMGDEIDYNLMKVIGHPKFDDIVKNYALIKHPEWLLRESVYVPQRRVSYFGKSYQSTVCSDVRNYIVFFVVCVIIFTFLSVYLKN